MNTPIRINKYLADKNIASRREADDLIRRKQVLVNGVFAEIGSKVYENDTVTLVGKTPKKKYVAYYKGRGIITHSPNESETDIASKIKTDYGINGLSPIGRLDKDSEGLLILTDDGRLTAPLLNSENNIEKEYTVTVDKNVKTGFQKLMEIGVMIEGYRTKPAKVITSSKNPKRFNIIITEGKKHQIRRMCAALGYQVQSLKRVRIANIEIKNLKPNQFRNITGQELKTLLAIIGKNK
jgi:23S rRNA pseudouridine2604 synthase